MKKIVLAAAIVSLSSGSAYATVTSPSGNSSTVTGSAVAKVIAPIVLTHVTNAVLNFGTFTAGQGGSVVVTSAGAGSVTGDVGFAPGNTNSADSFTVAGDPSRNFSIATQGGTITGTAHTSATMTFTTLPSATTGTTNSSGAASFTVGGTLTVAAAQLPDSYAGTYNATVAYD
jgi:hypothetical protein